MTVIERQSGGAKSLGELRAYHKLKSLKYLPKKKVVHMLSESDVERKRTTHIRHKVLIENMEDAKDQELIEGDAAAAAAAAAVPSSQDEEAAIKKKYGGIVPKKPPLISKDHERAYFDSADWALGKQGVEKPKGPLEALRPKLQPTQQQTRYRKSPYAPSNEEDGGSSGTDETATPNE
ncbi:hypothetical protein MLD38_024207 [Melastoma candidum]|uniref:Uncharacterized protein n=1 Tax=Melastoma candidum TaxID=119954 RepID=A0ACB9NUK4_9MYRT|nr:hypothetical protein MLD38_024207 [Melastoma candidum]